MQQAPAADDRVNILLVDDQPAKLLTYEVVLNELGENLIKVKSAREALAELLRNDIAVVLTDVSMPEVNGFELAAMIRQHKPFQSTAIIFVSAIHLTDGDLLQGYRAGAVDYLPVPIVPELLRAKVRVFAELYRKTRQLEERTREREAALAQIHEMQKMESLGQVVGGAAHDFNNLLMAILGNLTLLKRRVPEDPSFLRLIDNAIMGAERGATLTQRMLAFARRQELQPTEVDLSALIGSVQELSQRTLGPIIEMSVKIEPGLPKVRIDPNQLELSLLNLVINARDAMPLGGRLEIAAYREHSVVERSQLAAGEYVCVSVADSGTGMDEATLRRAVEPFFTTKGIGKGTGLGLPMVHGLATQSGGAMHISSALGHGTTVRLWLPVASAGSKIIAAPAAVQLSSDAPPRSPAGNCRVLVVDDDLLVSASTAAMLEDLGYGVVEAPSAEQCLDLLHEGAQVDVVITDQVMPVMTGLELARRIRQNWPELPVILATGYADLPENSIPDVPRLAKPFRQEALASCIAGLLRGPNEMTRSPRPGG
jgi:signal transduction histidine kinase